MARGAVSVHSEGWSAAGRLSGWAGAVDQGARKPPIS
jgi:hypothetical protein